MNNSRLKAELSKFNKASDSNVLDGDVISTIKGGANNTCGFKIGCDENCRTKKRR